MYYQVTNHKNTSLPGLRRGVQYMARFLIFVLFVSTAFAYVPQPYFSSDSGIELSPAVSTVLAASSTYSTPTTTATVVVPAGVVEVTVKAWGAGGGGGGGGDAGGGSGGDGAAGGYIEGTIPVIPGETLNVRVGGGGGGGAQATGDGGSSAGGGGYTGLFRDSTPLIVAGGGGGGGGSSQTTGGENGGNGGNGGGLVGGNATGDGDGNGGNGGTQSAGGNGGNGGDSNGYSGSYLNGGDGRQSSNTGAAGAGAAGLNGGGAGAVGSAANRAASAGGGGGYYGGGGGGSSATGAGGGGGGSSYVISSAEAISTESGSGITSPNSSDGDYISGVGAGATGQAGANLNQTADDGGDGLLALNWGPTVPVAVPWNDTDWTEYDTVTIDADLVDDDLTDFPVYVDLADLSANFWATTPSGAGVVGTDIRVTTNDGSPTELPRELVSASSTAQTGELHFKANTISSSTDTTFRIYYNGTTTGDYFTPMTYGAENVWTNNYIAVWHMNEDPSTTLLLDSTSNSFDGTSNGSMTSGDLVETRLGNGVAFDGSDDYFSFGDVYNTISLPVTFSVVTKLEGGDIGGSLLNTDTNQSDSGNYEGIKYSMSSTDLNSHYGDGGGSGSADRRSSNSVISVVSDTWHKADVIVSGATNATHYFDGESQSVSYSGTGGGLSQNSLPMELGRNLINGTSYFDGVLDEVRFSSTDRSAAWVSAEYENHNNANTFYSTAGPAEVWNDTDWTEYDTITIDADLVNETLTDFPVYIDMVDLSPRFWATTPSERPGADIRVTTNDGSPVELPRELVSASSTAQTGELHFKADSISSSADTVFRIYYNGTSTLDYEDDATYGAESVWSNDFLAVYHDGGSTDSTSYKRNAAAQGGVTEGNIAGQVGFGTDLDGATQAFISSDASNIDGLAGFTTSVWVEYDGAVQDDPIYTFDSAGYGVNNDLFTGMRFDNVGANGGDDDIIKAAVENNAGSSQEGETTNNTATNDWMLLHHTWHGTDNAVADVYKNGNLLAWDVAPSAVTGTVDANVVAIGRGNLNGWWDGTVDEFRVASTSRSEAWIAAEYENQNSPNTFYTAVDEASLWNAEDWPGRLKITINNEAVEEGLTDFPVYVNLADLPEIGFWNTVTSDCRDIRFLTEDLSTELPREVVSCDTATDTGEVHFKANSISSSVDTEFWMYFGNTDAYDYADAATYGQYNVWSSDYQAVFHMEDNGILEDSTSNNRGGAVNGTVGSGSGRVGGSHDYGGSTSDYAVMAEDFVLDNNDHTIQFWFNTDSVSADTGSSNADTPLAFWGQEQYLITFGDTQAVDTLGFRFNDGSWKTQITMPNISTADVWYHWTHSFDTDTGDYVLYTNGSSTDSATDAGGYTNNTGVNTIGTLNGDSRPYDGQIDEVRISSSTRSAAWVAAEYTNQATTTDFYTVGLQQLTVTGTVYGADGVTPVGAGETIKLVVATSTPSVHSTTTEADGAYAFFGLDPSTVVDGDGLTVFIDNDASLKAVTVGTIESTYSPTENFDLYDDMVTIGASNSGVDIDDLAVYDSSDDADILFTVDTSPDTLSLTSAQDLRVVPGALFDAPASTSVPSNLFNYGTIRGADSRLNLTGSGKAIVSSSTSPHIYVYGSYTVAGNATTSAVTIMSGGSITAPAEWLITGDFANNGTFTHNDGVVIFNSTSTQTIGGSLAGSNAFNDVRFYGEGNKSVAAAASTSRLAVVGDASFVGTWDPNDTNVSDAPDEVLVEGDYMYIASYNSDNLAIVDISNPASPTTVGNWDPNDTNVMDGAFGLDVQGNYAYISGDLSDNLAIVDISNPASPTTVGNWDPNNTNVMDAPGTVVVRGNYAYVAGYFSDNLAIVDISNPASPTTVGNWDPNDTNVIDGPVKFAIQGNYAYVTGSISNNLAIVDISNPASPTTVGNWDPNDTFVMDFPTEMDVSGSYVYIIARDSDNMAIVDVSSSTAPVLETNWYPEFYSELENPYGLEVVGDLAFIGSYLSDNVLVVDVSSSTNPAILSNTYNTTGGAMSGIDAVAAADGRLYVVGYDSDSVSVLDYTDLTVTAEETLTTDDFSTVSNVIAPNEWYLDGNYTNAGMVTHSNSTTYLTGTDTQRFSGDMIGSSAFDVLTSQNTGSVGTTTYGLIFDDAVSTKDTFTLPASSSVQFAASATSTFENIDWGGSASGPVYARSTAEGTQWYLDVSGYQLQVDYVDVQDSDASPSSAPIVGSNMTDSGNNVNWLFGDEQYGDAATTTWVVPDGVTEITVKAWGAGGGGAGGGTSGAGGAGGGGGFMQGTVSVTPGETLTLYVGGGGGAGDFSTETGGTSSGDSGGGGGYTAVFRGAEPLVLAAGGGGGGGGDNSASTPGGAGGAGGGASGVAGSVSGTASGGGAGTQSAGGAAGTTGLTPGAAGTYLAGGDGADGKSGGSTQGSASNGGLNGGGDGGYGDFGGGIAGGGAGGGGYYGGGGAAASVSGEAGGGGGGGGSSYATSTASATSTIAGSGTAAGNTADEDYVSGVGTGGTGGGTSGSGSDGTDGLLVIEYVPTVNAFMTLDDSDAGQVSNAISGSSESDAAMFAFALEPYAATGTVEDLVVSISGAKRFAESDIANVELYTDVDADSEYDSGTDTLIGSGAVSLNGDSGEITFATDFIVDERTHYIVVGDFVTISAGAYTTFRVNAEHVTGASISTIGSASSVQHNRFNTSGGGGGSYYGGGDSFGGGAPEGDGDVGGGSEDGGEDGGGIDTNTGGDTIGNAPDFFWPTANSGSWSSAASAYDQSDGTYATANTAVNHNYTTYNDPVPGSDSIEGVAVKLELSGTTAAGDVDVQLSWDGGSSWTSAKTTPTLTTTDAVVTVGGPADTWGRSWSPSEFSNANFAVRLTGNPSSNEIRLDAIQVRVYHQASGGGGGGGGSI